MKKEQDYFNDIATIRSMMERSSKFLSLSGWAGVMAGVFALSGAYIAWSLFGFTPPSSLTELHIADGSNLQQVVLLAIVVLVLSVGTAGYLSYKRAIKRGESVLNSTSKRLMLHMAAPLVSGGILILILLANGLAAFLAPLTLLFYGLALFSAGQFTYTEVRYLGLFMIVFGLLATMFPLWGLLFWAAGFGLLHIIYGVYIHMKYER